MPKRHPRVKLKKVDEDEVSWAAFIPTFGLRDHHTRGGPCVVLGAKSKQVVACSESRTRIRVRDQRSIPKIKTRQNRTRIQSADCN